MYKQIQTICIKQIKKSLNMSLDTYDNMEKHLGKWLVYDLYPLSMCLLFTNEKICEDVKIKVQLQNYL